MNERSPWQQARAWLQALLGTRPVHDGETPVSLSEAADSQATPIPAPAEAPDWSGLEKQLAKLGREQFKLNALIEAQQQQAKATLQHLREQDQQREKEHAQLLARHQAEQVEARLAVIEQMLPVLDGLDEALSAGGRLLERAPSPIQAQALGEQLQDTRWPFLIGVCAWPVIWLGKFFPRLVRRPGHEQGRRAAASLAAELAAWEDAQVGWLRGLEMVRERCLGVLATYGVQPIETLRRPFDPHVHVAVDTAPAGPDAPPGTIVSEVRRGYRTSSRVLRYAEVVVARPDQAKV